MPKAQHTNEAAALSDALALVRAIQTQQAQDADTFRSMAANIEGVRKGLKEMADVFTSMSGKCTQRARVLGESVALLEHCLTQLQDEQKG